MAAYLISIREGDADLTLDGGDPIKSLTYSPAGVHCLISFRFLYKLADSLRQPTDAICLELEAGTM
jgi:hypothetical protein